MLAGVQTKNKQTYNKISITYTSHNNRNHFQFLGPDIARPAPPPPQPPPVVHSSKLGRFVNKSRNLLHNLGIPIPTPLDNFVRKTIVEKYALTSFIHPIPYVNAMEHLKQYHSLQRV